MMWFIWLPLLIIAIVLVMRNTKSIKTKEDVKSPLDILKKRYLKVKFLKKSMKNQKELWNDNYRFNNRVGLWLHFCKRPVLYELWFFQCN